MGYAKGASTKSSSTKESGMKLDWLDNHSHSFEPLEPASKETDSAVEIPQADDAPQPGSKEYLSLGCDHLWIDIGGECG